MRPFRAWRLLPAAALVCCGPAASAPPPRVAQSVAVESVQEAIVVAPPRDATPFHREADVVVKVVPAKLKKTRVPVDGATAGIFSPDGAAYFVDARTSEFSGGVLFTRAHPEGLRVALPVHEASFSPDGKRLVLLDDDANVATVVSVTDGTVVGKWPGAFVARFLGGDALLVWQKCQLVRVNLTHPTAAPTPVGPSTCGAADASEDGRTWVIASSSSYPVLVTTRPYTLVQSLDAETGRLTGLVAGSSDEPISDVRLSPGGERVCFRAQGVQCLQLQGGLSALPKPSGDPFSLRWDTKGEQFLTTAAGDLISVDVRSRTVRTIGLREDVREWGFLPDGRRMFAYDRGAWLVDVTTGDAVEVYPKEVQVGVFASSPRSDRFLVGRVVGAGREVDLVELEP